MTAFEKKIEVRWADVDANQHVRHSAYYDYGAHVRIRYFAVSGFGSEEMKRLSIGPVLFKEECSFIREIHLNDTITINFLKGELTEKGSRWMMHHEIFTQQGKSAHITIRGAWMDLNLRKLTIPPADLAKALHELPLGTPYVYARQK